MMITYSPHHSLLKISLLLLWGALATVPAVAQSYPDHSVKLSVGFAPGTGPDVLARVIGQKLGENLKQPLVVDNRSGAGGQIAAQAVAKATPDGYNISIAATARGAHFF
jgi:tripartite-type tricarboxylate transporter receptor subunit TctC